MLEKTLESPLDCKEIQPVHPKGNQSWIFTGRTDAKAKALILWPPDVKNWLTGKDPDAGKDWRREKGTTEDETVGWHHQLDGQEFEQTSGVSDGQGSLLCYSSWDHKELDTNERLNWIYHCIYIHLILFIHSSVDKHLRCFHLQAFVNNVAVNTGYKYLFGSLLSILLGIRTAKWNY